MNKYISSWIDELVVQKRYSQCTKNAYETDLRNFLNFISNHIGNETTISTLNSLKTSDFRAWLSFRINNGLSARSNSRALSSVKSFFNYLARRKLLSLKNLQFVRRPKLAKLLPKPIQKDRLLNFLKEDKFFPNDSEWVGNRDKALYTLLYCTGLRISEALNIKIKDVSKEMKIQGKGKKDRTIFLLPIALHYINRYIESCPYDLNDGFLFVGVRGKKLHASYIDNRLQKLRISYNLPNNAGAHAFRHSFATHMIQAGADLRSVQELLGHESLSSTQIYTDIDDESILKIYAQTHPLDKT